MAAFEELGVQPEIIRAIDDIGWMFCLLTTCADAKRIPTPIQAEAIPLVLGGGDVVGVTTPPS